MIAAFLVALRYLRHTLAGHLVTVQAGSVGRYYSCDCGERWAM